MSRPVVHRVWTLLCKFSWFLLSKRWTVVRMEDGAGSCHGALKTHAEREKESKILSSVSPSAMLSIFRSPWHLSASNPDVHPVSIHSNNFLFIIFSALLITFLPPKFPHKAFIWRFLVLLARGVFRKWPVRTARVVCCADVTREPVSRVRQLYLLVWHWLEQWKMKLQLLREWKAHERSGGLERRNGTRP